MFSESLRKWPLYIDSQTRPKQTEGHACPGAAGSAGLRWLQEPLMFAWPSFFFFQVTVHIHSISSCSSSFDRESGSPAHEGKGRDTDKADAEKRILEVSKIGVRTPYPHLTNTFPANSPGTPASCHPPSSSPRPPWVSLPSTGYKRWEPLLEWTLLSSGSLSVSLGRLSAK